jgi:hypothetical protein
MRTIGFSQWLFAIASGSLALFSFAYGGFAPGGQPLPVWIPWRETLVYGSALLVLSASVGVCFPRAALSSIVIIGAYLMAWALTCVPQVLAKPLSFEGWYGFCEALSSLVGAWLLYAMLRWRSLESQMPIAAGRG